MIRVEVRLYASLRRFAPERVLGEALEIDLKDGSTLERLYELLGLPSQEVKRAFVNGVSRRHDHVLSDGDRVAIFPPVAGG